MIKPSDVRLNLRANDPYAWKVLPGKEAFYSQIFAKSLSDHSIGTYRLLCEEVGKTFEAVLSVAQVAKVPETIMMVSYASQST